nr:immunoglobulin heavy chain junction region [Mus musculus]
CATFPMVTEAMDYW